MKTNWNDIITGIFATLFAALAIFLAVVLGGFIVDSRMGYQCDNFGKARIKEGWYQCRKIEETGIKKEEKK